MQFRVHNSPTMEHTRTLALSTLLLASTCIRSQVPVEINGGFEAGEPCGWFYQRNNCVGPVETIGGTGWEYLIWPGAQTPTVLRTHAQGECDTDLSPGNVNQLSFPSGAPNNNPLAWDESPGNQHYIVIRHSSTMAATEAKGIHRPLPNGLCAGTTYAVRARYNYLKPEGQSAADMNVGLMIMTRSAEQALCGPPNGWNIVASETFVVQGDAQADWPVLQGEFTATGEEEGIVVLAKFFNPQAPAFATARIHVDDVELEEVTCPGDFNGDGLIDDADVSIFMPNLGADPSLPCMARFDINGDGVINFADLSYVLANFGLACTKSMAPHQLDPRLAIYPVPAHERVVVVGSGPVGNVLEVFDGRGFLVRSTRVATEGPVELDLRELSPGMYVLRSVRAGSVLASVRLIKE